MYKGRPFVPITALPVDMFPHTNRCEVIFVYERIKSASNVASLPTDAHDDPEVPVAVTG